MSYTKEIKISIINDLFDVLRDNLMRNYSVLTPHDTAEILMSCLIMFNRDVLVKLIYGLEKEHMKEGLLNCFRESLNEALEDEFAKRERAKPNEKPGVLH